MSSGVYPCPNRCRRRLSLPGEPAKPSALMLVRVGGGWFALDTRMIQEVAVKGAVTRVPTAARHVLGVTSLRGGLVPVISLEQMVGMAGPARAEPATTLPRLVVGARR